MIFVIELFLDCLIVFIVLRDVADSECTVSQLTILLDRHDFALRKDEELATIDIGH